MTATETKHTPGPWKIGNVAQDQDCKVCPILAGSDRLAQVLGGANTNEVEDWNDEDAANARLIAAAPELLAALKALVGPDGDLYCAKNIRDAQAAIAKAEGR